MKRNLFLLSVFIFLLFITLKFVVFPNDDMEQVEEPGENKTPVVEVPEPNEKPVEKPKDTEKPKAEVEKVEDEVVYEDDDFLDEKDTVFQFDKEKYFMNGEREKAEVKEKDYGYLLAASAKPFEPKIPPSWTKESTQIDTIEGYFEMDTRERMEKMKFKSDFTESEMKEWKKVNDINVEMNDAFYNGDYNTYAKNMYKGWREFHGIAKLGMIDKRSFYEEMLVFYPEKMDLEIGYAYGFYFREVFPMTLSGPGESQIWDGMIVYKQNDKEEWEVYYELPFEMEY